MKNLLKASFLLLISFVFTFSVYAQDSLSIEGTVPKSLDGNIITLKAIYPYPNNLPPAERFNSSIKDGKFNFNIATDGTELYSLRIDRKGSIAMTAFQLSPKLTKINFTDTLLKKYQIIGNNIEEEHKTFLAGLTSAIGKRTGREKWEELQQYREKEKAYIIPIIKADPNSALNAHHLFNIKRNLTEKEFIELYDLLPETSKKNSYGKELKFIYENLLTGRVLPNFSQTDTSGKVISLSDYRGRYVLVDLWASWCIPCREENPALVAAYNKYHTQGFDIISISVDDERKDWIAAIQKDQLKWAHVSDLKGRDNEVTKNYRINPIPDNFLLDRQGNIVARNLRGEELAAILPLVLK